MKRDPLDQLKLAEQPIEPRREFADALEERLKTALDVLLASVTTKEEGMQQQALRQTIHFGFPADDVGREIRWLSEIFGIKVLKYWGPEENPMYAYLQWRDGTIFAIAVRPPSDNAWSAMGPVSIGLVQPDEGEIERAYQRALAAGAEVTRELARSSNPAVPDGYLGFSLRDPEGNLWDVESVGGFELL